jgi:hypothetical protein
MNLIAIAALCIAPSDIPTDGMLVVLRDSNVIVKEYTHSSWTHIGILLKLDGEFRVFEAAPGAVRKVTVAEFFRDSTPSRFTGRRAGPLVYFVPPRTPFSANEVTAMRDFAVQQIGRRYSVKGFLRGRPVEGMNCAQFVAATLQQTGRVRFVNTFNQTPSSVLQLTRSLYADMVPVPLASASPERGWLDSAHRAFRDGREWLEWSSWEALHYWRK